MVGSPPAPRPIPASTYESVNIPWSIALIRLGLQVRAEANVEPARLGARVFGEHPRLARERMVGADREVACVGPVAQPQRDRSRSFVSRSSRFETEESADSLKREQFGHRRIGHDLGRVAAGADDVDLFGCGDGFADEFARPDPHRVRLSRLHSPPPQHFSGSSRRGHPADTTVRPRSRWWRPRGREAGRGGGGPQDEKGGPPHHRVIVNAARLTEVPAVATNRYFPGFRALAPTRPENRNLLSPATPWRTKPLLSAR